MIAVTFPCMWRSQASAYNKHVSGPILTICPYKTDWVSIAQLHVRALHKIVKCTRLEYVVVGLFRKQQGCRGRVSDSPVPLFAFGSCAALPHALLRESIFD